MRGGMRQVSALLARRPGFRRLWAGDLVSMLGDWLSYVAVSLLALQHGDGLVAIALVLVIHSLPHAVIAPVAGLVADRFDRRRVLLVANIVMAGLTVLMAVAAAFTSLLWVQILLVSRVVVGVFVHPAQAGALPRLVAADELKLANMLHSATWSMMFAGGVALGGLLSAVVGPTLAIAIDAGTFLVAAAILRGLPAIAPQAGAPPLTAVVRGMREAWQVTRKAPALFEAVWGKVPLAFASGGAWVTLNAVATEVQGLGAAAMALGLLQASRAIGTGIGPILMLRLEQSGRVRHAWTAAALATFAGAGIFAITAHPVWLLLGAAVWGVGIGANWVQTTTRRQEMAHDALQGRLSALDTLLYTAAQASGALGGAWVGEAFGSAASATLGLSAGLIVWVLLWAYGQRQAAEALGDPRVARSV